MSRLLRGKEGERFCIAPHRASHFKLGRTLQSWEKVTCVAPSPFGEEHWKTKSIKRPFVLDYCFTLRCRSFHLLTQINIHYALRYFGVPSLRSVSLRKIRFVQFGFLNFRPFCHPEFFTLYLLACCILILTLRRKYSRFESFKIFMIQ